MRHKGSLTLLVGAPCAELYRSVLQRAAKGKSLILSSNIPLLAWMRDETVKDPRLSEAFMKGSMEMKQVGEALRLFGDLAEVGMPTVAGLEHQAALLRSICSQIEESSPFYAAKDLHGFHAALANTLQELRHYHVDISDFSRKSPKLAEIARIEQELTEELASRQLTTLSERIRRIVEAKPKREDKRALYWVGETEWHPSYLSFARWLVDAGYSLTVTCEEHFGCPGFFGTRENLSHHFPECREEVVDASLPQAAALFGDGRPLDTKESSLTIVTAADDFVEVEHVLQSCASLLEKGIDPKEICIFVKSMETYGPMLHAASIMLSVPISIERREKVSNNGFARQVLHTLHACIDGSMLLVSNLVESGYSQIPRADRDEVVRQIRLCKREADAWTRLETLALDEANPVPVWLAALANWRSRARNASMPLSEWLRGLRVLLANTPWVDAGTEEDHSAQDAMIRSLEVLRFAYKTQPLSLKDFYLACQECWRNETYAVRIASGVRVVSTEFAIGAPRKLFLLGCLEGSLPGRRSEDPILLDRDRKEMNAGLPSSYDRAQEGRRQFYRLLCSCTDLSISFPKRKGEHEEIPSAYISELLALGIPINKLDISYEARFPKPSRDVPSSLLPTAVAWHPEIEFDAGEIVAAQVEDMKSAAAQALSSEVFDESAREHLGKVPNPIYISHLRSLSKCPFQYAMSARLGLNENREHSLLELVRRVVRRIDLLTNDMEQLKLQLIDGLDDELQELNGFVDDIELELLSMTAPSILRSFAEREMDARESWGIVPVGQEVSLENAEFHDSLPWEGGMIRFGDRIHVLYSRNQDEVIPMRIALYSLDNTEDYSIESGSLLLLSKKDTENRGAMIDSIGTKERKLLLRNKANKRVALAPPRKPGLQNDVAVEKASTIRYNTHQKIKQLLKSAAAANIAPNPGKHCIYCGFAALCRKAEGSEQSPWDGWIEDE